MKPCPNNDCGWFYLDEQEIRMHKIPFKMECGCPGHSECGWYKENVKEEE